MMKHRGKLWSCLVVIALIALTSGCGSGGSAGSTGSADPNAGLPVIVTVTDYTGIRVPDAAVVLGYSNGAMKAYGVTDADGQITFENAPVNAIVTAAKTCLQSGSTTTSYSIDVQYDVNGSAVLSLGNCAEGQLVLPPVNDPPLGLITVNVMNMPGNVTQYQMTIGHQIFTGLTTRQTVTLRENDLDSDGTFSVTVTGMDANHFAVAYGILQHQFFSDGMTVDVQVAPMNFVQFQITNLPTTAVSLRPSVRIYQTGGMHPAFVKVEPSYLLVSASSSTTVKVTYLPVVGDSVSYGIDVGLDPNHDGVADSHQSLSLTVSATTPTDQSFDLSKALPAPSVSVTGADTATPTFSWSGVDPAATSIYISAILHSSTTSLYLGPGSLMRSRTSIRYPELPDSLAAFRPTKVDYFSVGTYAYEGGVSKSSSGSYQAP